MNTSEIGTLAEAAILKSLLSAGYTISIPFGNHARYDFVIDKNKTLSKVQVKHAVYRNGCVKFRTVSSTGKGGTKKVRAYTDDIDLFAVYCSNIDKTYLVPVEDVPKGSVATLRIEPTKNNMSIGVRYANEYEMSK